MISPIKPGKNGKFSSIKKDKNLNYREYDVSGLSMLEKGFEDPKYVKSFNLKKTDGEDAIMDTIVPGGQNEFAD